MSETVTELIAQAREYERRGMDGIPVGEGPQVIALLAALADALTQPAPLTIDRDALGHAIFESLADRLGEHDHARNHEIADSGEYETKITGTVDVESLADWLTSAAVKAVIAHLSAQTVGGDKSPDFYRGYAIGCRDGETNAMRRIQVVQTNCALDAGNRIVAKRHDPHPIKVRNKVGDRVTTLPMSALGYHMPHEVQEFAPGAEFCQRPDHYFTVLGAAVTPDEQEGAE